MNLLVIYNPQAGNGRAKKLLTPIRDYISSKHLNAEIRLTERPWHAAELVEKAQLSEYDAIIASGGDGTLFEVLNGYKVNQSKNKPPLGLIPNGTGNAFMKELKLHKSDWKKAVDVIAKNQKRKIDIGRLTTNSDSYFFINIVGLGFVADIAKASVALKWMGNAAYTFATLKKLVNLKAENMQIEIDGVIHKRQAVLAEVANSTFTGTSFNIAPQAKLDDGLLDLILLNKISRLRLLKVFNSIYDGSHVKYPEVEYIQAKQIKITQEKPGLLVPDGEILGSSPVEFECLPSDIEFLWDYNLNG